MTMLNLFFHAIGRPMGVRVGLSDDRGQLHQAARMTDLHPKHSVCITTRNDMPTVRESLDALLSMVDPAETEVVVVDSESDDGQLEILKRYSAEGKIRLIVKKCTRGRGRQVAFEESAGDYIIAGVDTDDILDSTFPDLIKKYHTLFEGRVLKAGGPGTQPITIAPREVVISVGGWNDLYWGEDYDFWQRAKARGLYSEVLETPVPRPTRKRRGIVHTARVFWVYRSQGREPITSWKWKPLWALIRLVRGVAT